MIYKFIDDKATFTVAKPHGLNLYFPLTNAKGSLLSAISPNLAGDIKKDNDRFLTPPASIEDLRSNLLCRRDFFIKINDRIIRSSSPYRDRLEAGLLYHKIIKETPSLKIEIINFIPHDMDAEVMWVNIKNKTSKDITVTPTSFIPLYGRGEKNLRDHRHVSSLLNTVDINKYGMVLKPTMCFDEKGHTINKTNYFCFGYEGNRTPPVGQFPTLDYFCGLGTLENPDAITKNVRPVTKKSGCFDGKETCAAFRFRTKKIKKHQSADYFLIMGINDDLKKIHSDFSKLNSRKKIQASLKATKEYWLKLCEKVRFDFSNIDFDNWLRWVGLQPTFRRLFGCSFLPHFDYGKGGRGWRDLWQDALALLATESDKAKAIILNSFGGVRIDGSNATIITKEGDFICDRNKISRVWMDHGVWPFLTLSSYINKTADTGILLKETTYFCDHQLKRAQEINPLFSQKDNLLRTKRNKIYKGSILEHLLIQNLIPFFNVGKKNIIRLENADWNDGLDMAAQNGQSAAFSFMYAYNLKNLCALLKVLKKKQKTLSLLEQLLLLLDRLNKPVNYNSPKERQKRLQLYFEKTKDISGKKKQIKIDDLIYDLEEKSKHLFKWLREKEWLKEGFFNGYYDNKNRRVEGRHKGKIRMMLPSQVFPIMSGAATKPQIKKIWSSINRYLKDKKMGGFRLNTDFGHPYLELGRAFGFSYGDKENGAFFSHMNVMFANALYRQDFIKEASQVMDSIYNMAVDEAAKIYPLIPEYFNQQGSGLYLYLTGSASWYVHTLIEEVLGIKFILGDLYLAPKLTADNFWASNIKISFSLYGKKINVLFLRPKRKSGACVFKNALLDKKEIPLKKEGFLIKKDQIKKIKQKEITVKIYLT